MRFRDVTGEAPFITKCRPSKKSAEYCGYDAIGLKPSKGEKGVDVHSQPFPMRSSTPQALAPSGEHPIGSGSKRRKSKFP
jgi:hypothetical protein